VSTHPEPNGNLGNCMPPFSHLLDRFDLEFFGEARLRLLRFHQHLHEASL
jgi:hypothetical protein